VPVLTCITETFACVPYSRSFLARSHICCHTVEITLQPPIIDLQHRAQEGGRGNRVKGAQKALRVVKEVHKVGSCLFTGKDGIGGVVMKPLFLRTSHAWAVVKDVGVGAEAPTIRAVCAVIGLGPKSRRVVHCRTVTCGNLEGDSL
jgi:hypothetical protein